MKKYYMWKNYLYDDYEGNRFDNLIDCMLEAEICEAGLDGVYYVGEFTQKRLSIDVHTVLDNMVDSYCEMFGIETEELKCFSDVNNLLELQNKLENCVYDWMEEYNNGVYEYELEREVEITSGKK